MNDPTITHDKIIVLFRLSRNGPVTDCRKHHKALVAACETAVKEAARMGSWAPEMLDALNTLMDEPTHARVFPAEIQYLLDAALEKAGRDEKITQQSYSDTTQTQPVEA